MGNILKSVLVTLVDQNDTRTDEIEELLEDDDKPYPRLIYSQPENEMISEFVLMFTMDLVLLGIPMVLTLFILMLMTKRKNLCPRCCWGYYGLLVPVNFFEGRRRRKAFISAFALTCMSIIDFLGVKIDVTPFAAIFTKLIYVTFLGLRFLPLLACIHMGTVASSCIGLFYLIVIIFVNILKELPAYEGVPSGKLLKELLLPGAIMVICGNYLTYWFIKQIVLNCKGRVAHDDTPRADMKYVRNLIMPQKFYLMQKAQTEDLSRRNKCVQLFRKYIYRKVPGFRYSLTILVSFTIGFLIITHFCTTRLYSFIKDLIDCLYLLDHIHWLKELKMGNIVAIILKAITKDKEHESKEDTAEISVYEFVHTQSIIILVGCLLAAIIAYFLSVMTICHMLMTYRENVLNLAKHKAKQDIIEVEKDYKCVSLVKSAIQYGGYQVAYLIAGFLIHTLVFTLVFIIAGEVIVLPLQFAIERFLLKVLEIVGPIVLALIIVHLTQYLLLRFVFLEDSGKTMALTNRRGFFIMTYIVFFYNIFTGVFSCAKRVIISAVIGLIFIARLDRSIFPKQCETRDSGFRNYSSLLYFEAVQSNPIVRTFAHVLTKRCCTRIYDETHNTYEHNMLLYSMLPRNKQLAQNRWFVAYTLIRNPSICHTRASYVANGMMKLKDDYTKLLRNDKETNV